MVENDDDRKMNGLPSCLDIEFQQQCWYTFQKDDPNSLNCLQIEKIIELNFSSDVTSIDEDFFPSCEKILQKVSFHNGFTSIGDSAFSSFPIQTIEFSEGLLQIGSHAFLDLGGVCLNNLSFPASLQTIGDYAFSGARTEGIRFAANSQLTFIGELAFSGCQNLKSVFFEPTDDSCPCLALANQVFGNSENLELAVLKQMTYKYDENGVVQGTNPFLHCWKLTQFEFHPKSQFEVWYGIYLWYQNGIEIAIYPESTKVIKGSGPDQIDERVKEIRFPKNSQLVELDASLIPTNQVASLYLPPSLERISKTFGGQFNGIVFHRKCKVTELPSGLFIMLPSFIVFSQKITTINSSVTSNPDETLSSIEYTGIVNDDLLSPFYSCSNLSTIKVPCKMGSKVDVLKFTSQSIIVKEAKCASPTFTSYDRFLPWYESLYFGIMGFVK